MREALFMRRGVFGVVALGVVLAVTGCGDSSSSAGADAADRVWMRLGAQNDAPQLCVALAEPTDERDRVENQLRRYEEISSLSDEEADVAVAQIVELCGELVEGPRVSFAP